MVSWLTVAVLALTCVVYAAFCAAVVRAFFRTRVNRTAYRAAGAWAACFGVTLVGSLMALDTRGVDAAATFAACACLLSFPSCLLLERRWRYRDRAVPWLICCSIGRLPDLQRRLPRRGRNGAPASTPLARASRAPTT
ncbi:MAG: hypothetical protein ACLU7P_05425 [Eggerthella lenta]